MTTPFIAAGSRSWRLVGAGLLLTLLGACTSTADLRAADQGRCHSYGFRPGTDAFSKCLLDLDLNRDADRRAFRYETFRGWGYGGPGRFWW